MIFLFVKDDGRIIMRNRDEISKNPDRWLYAEDLWDDKIFELDRQRSKCRGDFEW